MYLAAELKHLMGLKQKYEKLAPSIVSMLGVPYNSKGTTTFKLKNYDKLTSKMGAEEAAYIKQAVDLLNRSKFIVDESRDYKKGQMKQKTSVILNNKNLFDINVVQNNNIIGISVPVFYSKYFTFDKNNLTPVYQKFGITNGPKKIITDMDVFNAIKVSPSDLEGLLKSYGLMYVSAIAEEDVTIKPGVDLETSEGKIKCNMIMVSFNKNKMAAINVKLAEKIAGDEKLQTMIIENYVNILKLYNDAGYLTAADKSTLKKMHGANYLDKTAMKKWLATKLKNDLATLKKAAAAGKLNQTFVMKLFVDQNMNIIERRVWVQDKTNPKSINSWTLKHAGYMLPKSKKAYSTFAASLQDSSGRYETILNSWQSIASDKKSINQKIALDVVVKKGRHVSKPIYTRLNMNIAGGADQSKVIKSDYLVSVDVSGDSLRAKGNCSLNLKGHTITSKFTADGSISASRNVGFGFTINSDANTTLGVPVQVPAFTKENSLNLGTATDQELAVAFSDIQNKAMLWFLSNAQTLGLDVF